MVTLLKSKIHHARVTDIQQDYVGSIFIDEELLKKVNIIPFEKVEVVNVTNGERFTTYAYPDKTNSGVVSVRGGAAHLCKVGDTLIILAFEVVDSAQANPKMILVDEDNIFLEEIVVE